jgi:hypothetical protein
LDRLQTFNPDPEGIGLEMRVRRRGDQTIAGLGRGLEKRKGAFLVPEQSKALGVLRRALGLA